MSDTRKSRADIVREKIRQRIFAGVAAPSERLASERDLASEFGVDTGTVRRALVRLVDEGLVVKRPRVGNFVCDLPDTVHIGIVFPAHMLGTTDIPNPAPRLVASAVAQEFDSRKYAPTTMIFRVHCFRTDVAEVLISRGVRGILLWPDATIAVKDIASCMEAGIKIVLLQCQPQLQDLALPVVTVESSTAFRRILRRVLDMGHRRLLVGFYTNDPREWEKAAADAILREYGISAPCDCLVPLPNAPGTALDDIYAPLLSAIASKPSPTAVIVPDEYAAAEVFRYCLQHGIRIPEDMSVAAIVDNSPRLHPVPLTASDTVDVQAQAIRWAAKELRLLLEGENPPERMVALRCNVLWRASLGAPPMTAARGKEEALALKS